MFNEKYSHEKKFTFDSKANEFISLKEFAQFRDAWRVVVCSN